jgi:hypothetical protein
MEKVPEKLREAMWGAFQERQSNRHVSRATGVSRRTVAKYRLMDNWDERYQEIRQKAFEKVDAEFGDTVNRDIQIIRGAKGRFVQALFEGKIHFTVSDYDKLVKLELLLSGHPTERSEQLHRVVEMGELTDAELSEIIEAEEEDEDAEENEGPGEGGASQEGACKTIGHGVFRLRL